MMPSPYKNLWIMIPSKRVVLLFLMRLHKTPAGGAGEVIIIPLHFLNASRIVSLMPPTMLLAAPFVLSAAPSP